MTSVVKYLGDVHFDKIQPAATEVCKEISNLVSNRIDYEAPGNPE